MNITNLKRFIAAGLSIATLAGLSACGRKADSSSEANSNAVTTLDDKPAKGDLNIWAIGNEGEKLPKFVDAFNKENPDAHIKVTSIPWSSAHDKFQTAIAAGNEPDMAQMANTWMADFSQAFAQTPKNLSTKGFPKDMLSEVQLNDKTLGLPWYADTRVLYYRTDLAKKAGWDHAPKTWDELKQMASDLKKAGVDNPLRQLPKGTDAFMGASPFYFSSNGDYTDGSKWTLDSEGMKKGMKFSASFFKEGLSSPNVDANPGSDTNEFVSGKTAMLFGGPTSVGQINEAGGEGMGEKFATAPIPKMDEKSDHSTSYLGGCDWVVFKDSKKQETAWKFIRWASQPKNQVLWYKLSTDLPTQTEAWNDPELKNDDKLAAFGEQLKHAKPAPSINTWQQVSSVADGVVEKIYRGTVSVDDGMKDLQSQADSIGLGK
jgi:multiple sugar transport system substrate-binding protein